MTINLYLQESIILVALISGIPLLLSTGAALAVAVLQAATQVQEQSLGFVVKLVVIGLTLFVGSGVFWTWCMKLLQRSLTSLAYVGT